jgi:hypothetical protein
MSRKDQFADGNQRRNAHGHCVHCGDNLGSSGTMRRGGDMFDAEGATVYSKRREPMTHVTDDNEAHSYRAGKYCSTCTSEAEAAERANDR